MVLGRGLQSLIPPKNNDGEEYEDKKIHSHIPAREYQKIEDALPKLREVYSEENYIHRDTKRGEIPQKQESVFHIEIDKIKPNPYQPRKDFNEEELRELAQSIKEFGIIQPLVVSKSLREKESGADVEYQLIAGERRLRAAKMVGLERVPAIIKHIDAGKAKLEVALIENIQRSNLNALESARAYARLQDEFGLTQREIGLRVGKSRESIANTLRLLNLPQEIQEALLQEKINESQARILLSIADPLEQMRVFRNLISEKLSVRELRQKTEEKSEISSEQRFWERKLQERYQAPIKITKRGARGKIVIPFYSEEELATIVEKLLGEDLL